MQQWDTSLLFVVKRDIISTEFTVYLCFQAHNYAIANLDPPQILLSVDNMAGSNLT